jgi:superfamily II DNA or RNA helicase
MTEHALEHNLAALAGKDNWQLGQKLYREGAILDLKRVSRSVVVRIAGADGGFHSLKLTVRQQRVTSQCSCSKHSLFCEHAVAALLAVAHETPDLISFLKEDDYSNAAPVPGPGSAPAKAPPKPPSSGLAAEALRSLLASPVTDSALLLNIDGTVGTMESHWNHVNLTARIAAKGRTYAAGNIRRLLESERAAGNLRLVDFPPRDQQVMRYLVQNSLISGNNIQVNAYELSDLFHLLSGGGVIHTSEGRATIHQQQLQVIVGLSDRQEACELRPRIELPGHGVLPPAKGVFIAGRGGYWIGYQNEFWWLPGALPLPWLLLFLRGTPIGVSQEQSERLGQLVQSGRLPVELRPAETLDSLTCTTGDCRPVLTLDWPANSVVATLEFSYSGRRLGPDEKDVVWAGAGFVRRDEAAERTAVEELRGIGFASLPNTPNRFRLSRPANIWRFLQKDLDHFVGTWQVLWTPAFTRRAQRSGEINLTVSSGRESDSWFETVCELATVDGASVPWDQLAQALERGDEFLTLEDGSIVRLPSDVMRILHLLLRRAAERDGDRLRFERFNAVALVDLIDPYTTGFDGAWSELRERLLHPSEVKLPRLSPSLDDCLRGYQKDGVRWLRLLEECGFHGVLADEMGLGKTVQALAAVLAHRQELTVAKPSIVVCPTSLVENWLVEAQRFVPELKTMAVRGADRQDLLAEVGNHDLVVTSYALLRRDVVEYETHDFDYIILDEAQHIKNPRTANATACKELRGDHRLVLTGTPIENSLSEIWSIFDFLLPGYLGSQKEFRQDYEAAAPEDERDRALIELASHVHPFILRRTKEEVCDELPSKMEQVLFCELGPEQRHLYNTVLTAGRQMLHQAQGDGWRRHRFELLSILMRLRQICCHPDLLPDDFREGFEQPIPSVKMDLAREVILEAIDSGSRILLFSQFTSVLKLLPPWLEENGIRYEYLDGATKDRQMRVDRFNADDGIPIFLLSLKAGGTGLNLTGANTVIHYDQWWNPMVEDQATDRTHRIGQTRSVTAIKLVARHTIEEKILALQESKRDLFRRLIAGAPGRLGELTEEDVAFLLSQGK